MPAKERTSITYYVGLLNLLVAAIWLVLYAFGLLTEKSIYSPTALPFYVGTLFAVGFGIVFPFYEKTVANRIKINRGIFCSVVALVTYAGMIASYHFLNVFPLYDLRQHF